jgi:integrase
MARRPEIGNVQIYPDRPLRESDRNGYVLKFYCPLVEKRVRKNCGTRDRREAGRLQRECRQRLLNGEYVQSGGLIAAAHERAAAKPLLSNVSSGGETERTWEAAIDSYRDLTHRRLRRKSSRDAASRLDIVGRILEARRKEQGLPPGVTLREAMSLEAVEYVQNRLMDGAESKYEFRSPNTVNTMMGAVMAFVRYCRDHEWVERIPPLRKLSVDDVMKGRPITGEEFERMLEVVPKVVGTGPAASWRFALMLLWESGFRIADLMDFSWDDITRIHPVWPRRTGQHPTLVIPSTQKNGKNEEIPMLPGMAALLSAVPEEDRKGFVASPEPMEYNLKSQQLAWFRPRTRQLAKWTAEYSDSAISKACGVSDHTVRKWLQHAKLERSGKITKYGSAIPAGEINKASVESTTKHRRLPNQNNRLTVERVGRIIAEIGKQAKVVVRQPIKIAGRRIKYASAHDLRRSCAERLINAGVSAESLMVIMRHRDFATTRKHYGATKAAQAAATEVNLKLTLQASFLDSSEGNHQLSSDEITKLRRLLQSSE